MPVELGYFTLKVRDTEQAKTFYGAVFGWTFEAGSTHVQNTKFPLGLAEGGRTTSVSLTSRSTISKP